MPDAIELPIIFAALGLALALAALLPCKTCGAIRDLDRPCRRCSR